MCLVSIDVATAESAWRECTGINEHSKRDCRPALLSTTTGITTLRLGFPRGRRRRRRFLLNGLFIVFRQVRVVPFNGTALVSLIFLVRIF